MRFLRLGEPGMERPVVHAADDRVYHLDSLALDIDGDFLANDGIRRTREAIESGALRPVENWRSLRVGPPVSRPGAVICIGMNYAAHAAESGGAVPESPVIFFKHPNTIVGPDDQVLLPPNSSRVDWEVELAIVIGRRSRYLSGPEVSKDYIAGFTISNDVSEREYQIELSGGQWSKGKCAETFNPLGPALIPVDQLDYNDLHLGSSVNGERRQDSSTSDMVFSVDYLVWYLSQFMVLEPGDIINTGTPAGVALSGRFPYLVEGDEMVLNIEGIGEQKQRVQRAVV